MDKAQVTFCAGWAAAVALTLILQAHAWRKLMKSLTPPKREED